MKTSEEIKRGLENCRDKSNCQWCPNSHICELEWDALAYIRQLEREKGQLMREKEELIDGIRGLCGHCKHWGESSQTEPCFSCIMLAAHNWEWRGVEEDET